MVKSKKLGHWDPLSPNYLQALNINTLKYAKFHPQMAFTLE